MTTALFTVKASLFSVCGKIAVTVRDVDDSRVTICAPQIPPIGSAAILVSNGIKVPAVIAIAVDGRLDLEIETLAGWRRHRFIGAAGPTQPHGLIAA